jgi:cell division protein FtsQ
MQKVKNIVFWSLLGMYLFASLSFVSNKRAQVPCTKVEVCITDTSKNKFISNKDIYAMLFAKNMKFLGTPIESINTKEVKEMIDNYPPIGNTTIYKTIDGKLKIEITQRDPILRVINNRYESYYIDKKGTVMPLSGRFTSHALIANGNIKQQFRIASSTNILTSKKPGNIVQELYIVAKFVKDNDFWNSQIVQMYVNEKQEIELIPRVGSQIIILGDTSDMEEKFHKLEVLYLEGLKYTGWNNYETINLKYKNQIICTKR